LELLNFESEKHAKRDRPSFWRRHKKILLWSSALTGIICISSTLAASINLNLGSGIEFGQGMTSTVACSGQTALTLTPTASYQNSPGSETFDFTGLTVGNIPTSCFDKDFVIKVYGSSTSTPLPLFKTSSTDVVVYDNAGTFIRRGSPNNNAIGMTVTNTGTGQFHVDFESPVTSSELISKLTIESFQHDPTIYFTGEIGPGGGIVFYRSVNAFTASGASCSPDCHYLELAPQNWHGSEPAMPWSLDTTNSVTGLIDGIGKGFANTQLIANQPGGGNSTNNVALLALSYDASDSSAGNWYVPSRTELQLVYNFSLASSNLGGLIDQGWYWSTTEESATSIVGSAYNLYPFVEAPKAWNLYLRPIRAF